MTTLVVTSSWPRTGDELAGTFVRTDALERARAGRVIVAAPDGPGRARGGEGLMTIDVPHGGLFGSPGAAERLRVAPWRALGLTPFSRAISSLVRETRPSTIVAHWLLPCGLVASAALPRRHDIAIEHVAHGADVRLLAALPRSLARRLVERIMRDARDVHDAGHATRVRAVSAALADRLLDLAPSLAGRLFVAPMPLATDDGECLRRAQARALQLRDGVTRLHVVACRFTAGKRVERAIDHVAAEGGRIVLVGDGPRLPYLVAHALRTHVDARFVGARPHDEALAWIAAADVVLAPLARDEGAPTVIREARSLGRPVVCLAA